MLLQPAIAVYDSGNKQQQDFVISCMMDSSWQMIRSARPDQHVPPIYAAVRYAATCKSSRWVLHLIVNDETGYAAFVSVHWNLPIASIIGGVAPRYNNSGRGIVFYASLIDLLWSYVPGLSKITVKISEKNRNSLHMHEAIGFQMEGRLRREFYDVESREYCDCCLMGIFQEEFYNSTTRRILKTCAPRLSAEALQYLKNPDHIPDGEEKPDDTIL